VGRAWVRMVVEVVSGLVVGTIELDLE
jgi:hypothetical protein